MKKKANCLRHGGAMSNGPAKARFARAVFDPTRMGAADAAAIASGVSGPTLMDAAGRAVAAEIVARCARPASPVAILCGPGNNGGDGYVIAGALTELGWPIAVYALAPAISGTDAERAARRWAQAGGETRPLDTAARQEIAARASLVVDALFGAGLSRPLGGGAAALMRSLDEQGAAVVAVDTPSGLCGASGRVWGAAAHAIFTVTFERLKAGHVLAEGPEYCGPVVVAPIGIPEGALEIPSDGAPFLADDPAVFSRSFAKSGSDHKYGHGHAIVASGGQGATGAARLAAISALRVGAGLVTIAAPPEAVPECAAQLTAVMLKSVQNVDAFAELIEDSRLNAVALGPGLARGAGVAAPGKARAMVEAALDSAAFRSGDRTVVLDADALTAFADAPGALFERLPHGPAILTPHFGEFHRLFPDLAQAVSDPADASNPPASKADIARDAARRANAVILLKGADTVVAAPTGEVAISAAIGDRAAPWLATAGSGDVLAGLIAGLAARGFCAFEAAAAGAFLHVEAALEFGPGLIAEDLPQALPAVIRRLSP